MLIRLEYNGRIVQEIRSKDISGELTIGRSKKCVWVTPDDDAVISSQHACVFVKGSSIWFKDLESKNGSFFKGKRIARKKLRVGDRISVGNGVLSAEKDSAVEAADQAAEIVVRMGKSRGQKKTIEKPEFTIGSDPASDLVLLDSLVSRNHALVTLKDDGSCWIKDLESKNGTSVNGLPLREDKERMLKNNDVISLAHLEIEFHDGSARRSSGQAWLRLGIMAATLVIALGLFWTFQRMRPSAEHFIKETRRLAMAKDFQRASEALSKATGARKYQDNHLEVSDLRRLLSLWQSTVKVWDRAQLSLSEGKWVTASRDLGLLGAAKKEAWGWSPDGVQEKAAALTSKRMLDALMASKSIVRRDDMSIRDLREALEAVISALDACGDSCPEYAQKVRAELVDARGELEQIIEEGSGMESALDKLRQKTPPYEEIIAAVESVQNSAGGAMRRKASLVHDAVKALSESFQNFTQCANHIRALDFAAALKVNLALPPVNVCAVDPRVSAARTTLDAAFQDLRAAASQLAHLQKQIDTIVENPTAQIPGAISAWQNDAVMTDVFACDSLKTPLPGRSRSMPSGEYDRMLGVEEFYYVLSSLPDAPDPGFIEQMPVTTVLTKAKDLLKYMARFKDFLDKPDNRWLVYGEIARVLTQYESVLATRDTIVETMVRRAQSAPGREALIAGGIAMGLAADPKAIVIDGVEINHWLPKKLKELRSALQTLNTEYSSAAPLTQIEIRNRIMKTGLPGDPFVRRMWASRDASGGH